MQDFVPKGHVSRFIIELVRESLDLKEITGSYVSGLGQPPFDPRMMVALLLHSYASGGLIDIPGAKIFAHGPSSNSDSLRIEQRLFGQAPSLAGGIHVHPDCIDFESPTDYPSIDECRQAANPAGIPVPKGGTKWVMLHCAQVPEQPSK